jgi:D-alanyl-D-alanine carboxypeptidase
MLNRIVLIIVMLIAPFQALQALDNPNLFEGQVNSILGAHYAHYQEQEYFSGISLSIYRPGFPIRDYYIGQVAHEKTSKKIAADTLFQIGSITKSFTAAIILQLEKENKLHLTDTIEKWLPEYNKWFTPNIEMLLNMTSGLPNYSDSPLMNTSVFQHPDRLFSESELINFVYPPAALKPPLKTGYFYTNTSYILTAMLIEKITQHSFKTEIENRLFKAADLKNTFYPVPHLDPQVTTRIAHGYGFNPYTDPQLVGKETQDINLSWAGAAGAVISNTADVIKWIKALFLEDTILDEQQKNSLMKLVSTTTGGPIANASLEEPHAFGLGVIQGFDKDMGQYWFYEGQTQGFRALYLYVPSNSIIISAIFNSSVNSENDHASELLKKIYKIAKENLV